MKPGMHVLLTFDICAQIPLCDCSVFSHCWNESVAFWALPVFGATCKHLVPWICSFVVSRGRGFAWAVYLALCLIQLHSKQRRLTPSVQFCVSGIFFPCLFIYSCRALRKSAASPQRFALRRGGCRELLRSDLWWHACITFHFKPISTLRNSRVYEVWCLAVPVSSLVQQAASFIQITWTVMQSDFSTWLIQVNTQRGTKTAARNIWGAVEEEYSQSFDFMGKMSTDVETGSTMEHYRNVCKQ